jgi:hypothetical protein
MARIYLLSTKTDPTELARLLTAAALDRVGVHHLAYSPKDADLILFTDPSTPDMLDIRRHPIYREHSSRCFVMVTGDRVLPFVPGLFVCPEKTTHPSHRSRTAPYLRVVLDATATRAVEAAVLPADGRELLFSFVGRSETASVRKSITRLRHPRALIIDASHPDRGLSGADFIDVLLRSKFVLCPRGYGSSSFRLFETLRAGRVPVIISDEWIPCTGPDWSSFSLIVPEAQVDGLSDMIEEAEQRHTMMRQAVKHAWAEWFAPDITFHRIVEWCLEVAAEQPGYRAIDDHLYQLSRYRPSMLRWHWEGRVWRQQLRAKIS